MLNNNPQPVFTQPQIVQVMLPQQPLHEWYLVREPDNNFNPEEDQHKLYKAIQGLGTDERALISVIGTRSKNQLIVISELYGKRNKNSLEKDLKGDCSGNFLKLQLGLVRPIIDVKLKHLRDSCKGIGTFEKGLIDVLCLASPEEIAIFHNRYPDLSKRVSNELSGDFKKLMEHVLEGKRLTYQEACNHETIQALARELFDAGERRVGTDESTFIRIFTKYPREYLQAIDRFYHEQYSRSLRDAIIKETSFNFQLALLALIVDPWDHYTDRLYHAMKGLGTEDTTLVYIFSILEHWQLDIIKKMFKERHHKELSDMLRGDTSGHYRDLLLARLGKEH